MNYGRKIESVEYATLSTAEKALNKLRSGRVCRVDFIKKDNTLRTMVCRTGVHKHTTGGGRGYDPADKGLITVFEFGVGYRTVAIDRIVGIKHGGVWHSLNGINRLPFPVRQSPNLLEALGRRTFAATTSPMYG